MAYTVLARRYRSATFDEVVGQNHVAQTLKKAITSGRIAHAYLFNGTRGVGKTSMARILAKALNCEKADSATPEPCLQCPSCQAIARGEDLDVIEIDAASNTGVDNVREIIENAQYRPARSRFKVYIIDEVHMLSKSAFNALLKTLEEPPEHVKFILATTEPEKVLPTILSRCQRYDFRNIPTREIAGHLRNICQDEKIQADEDALMMVAKAGAGSMRDSLSLLDRLLSIGEKHLTLETIEQLLGLPRTQLVFDLVQAIGQGRVADVLSGADRMISEGLSPDGLIASLIDHLRNLLVLRTCGPQSNLVEVAALSAAELDKQAQQFDPIVLSQDITILEELRRQMRQSQAGRALLDATLVRLALAEQFTSIADLLGHVDGGAAAGSAAQKKNFEPPVTPAPSRNSISRPPAQPPPPEPSAPAPAPPEEEDDLPRPGKVWDNSGPSLAELLKQQSPAPPQPQSPPPASSPPATPGDLPAIWRNLLKRLQEQNAPLHGLVSHGKLAGIIEGQAVIRYGPEHATFPTMLGRNGKREALAEVLSEVVGGAIGVRFEVDEGAPAPAERPPGPTPPRSPGRPAAAPEPPPAAPVVNSIRPTPEQVAEFERDPLIGGLMSQLGATILKISEDA